MAVKGKVIFIDSVHPILFERLEFEGYECHWKNDLDRESVLKIIGDYEGAVIRSKFKFDKKVFDAASQLKWIARSGAGMENIDLETAKNRKITCYNSPEGNRDAVAEHAIGMLLSLFNNIIIGDQEVRKGEWNREKNRGIELKGKTVGILGYGFMGEAFSQRLIGFGVNCIAYDKYKKDYANEFVKEVNLNEFFRETDILSVHLPLTDETHFIVNREFISKFSKPIYIINTARGKNIKTEELINAVENGKVLGACLDVLEYESISFEKLSNSELPNTFNRLINSKKVILSPHVAGWTKESYFKLSNSLADKILSAKN